MTEAPEHSSTNRGMVVGGFALVLGGFLTLLLIKLGLFSVPGVLFCILIGAGVGWIADAVMVRGAAGLVGNIFAAGNIAPAPSYPVAETLIVRGKFAEAAEHFRSRVRTHPQDFEARLRLAELDVAHLSEFEEAERLYKEVRDAREDPRRELAAFNGLIDLHARSGRRDRLKVELARFADRYAGTRHAQEARRRLEELKADG